MKHKGHKRYINNLNRMAENIEQRMTASPSPSPQQLHYFKSELTALLVAIEVMTDLDNARVAPAWARNTILAEQRRFLDKRLLEHAREQPEILALKTILLAIAGEHLVAPPSVTQDTFQIVESGFLMEYPVVVNLMEPNRCHLNSARLIASGEATALCTGYALHKGLWRQHSWALKRQKDGTNRILETTGCEAIKGASDKYFGILYWGMMALCIARSEFHFNGVELPPALDRLKEM